MGEQRFWRRVKTSCLKPAQEAAEKTIATHGHPASSACGLIGWARLSRHRIHLLVEPIRIVCLVAAESFGQFVEEASSQNGFLGHPMGIPLDSFLGFVHLACLLKLIRDL